jgi:phosphoribosylformylglycinamidine synthase
MTSYYVRVRARHEPDAPQHLYLLAGALQPDAVARIAAELLHDPVVQEASWGDLAQLAQLPGDGAVEIAYRPGVTDNEAESIRVGIARLGIAGLRVVRTLRRYRVDPTGIAREQQIRALHNPLIETAFIADADADRAAFYQALLHEPAEAVPQIARVPLLDADDAALLQISRDGILALDLDEMRVVRDYFRQQERPPTDGELETIAQTWSEHCSHKTFKAKVRYANKGTEALRSAAPQNRERYAGLARLERDGEIDSLIRTFLMEATNRVLAATPASGADRLQVLSAFVDNAGIVAFGDAYELSFKVETHNHPSALEPFGGANTGVGGVVRDVLGVSAQPIANTDVLCFGPLDTPEAQLGASAHHHPRRIAAGVVAGVRDYGNKLGIPTINGAVLYDPGYLANPLVFCGTVGLAPRGRHPRSVAPGDAIVVIGGRTGRDGIHGATFSSVELTHTTAEEVGSAVQIGDPITEKKMIDVILQARDAGLYSAITDCGAGGLSSAVGEMGEQTGAHVALDDVPLKYAGLQPWEIWLSEAQERMVLAVPQARLNELLALCAGEDVEATVIGRFSGDQRLVVQHRGATLVDLDMAFLHGGRPQRVMEAVWEASPPAPPAMGNASPADVLLALLAHPNIASKEPIVRTYDHEVGGRTVIKPFVGVASDGPGDAAVLQPSPGDTRGIAIGCGVNPRYGRIDPYWMALAVVDEALRNVVAVGGDPAQAAILDNFCWGNPRRPEQMAGLVRAAAGCYDAALAYGAPFISGKDSLNNEYLAADGSRIPIPPTLLISALALVPDVRRAITSDFKSEGNLLFLVGETAGALGGAHALDAGLAGGAAAARVPQVDLERAPQILAALHHAIAGGLVRACHDLSEGGLAVAAAEMAIAGRIGAAIDLRAAPRTAAAEDAALLLFDETPTRFLVEVAPTDADAFTAALDGMPCAAVGRVGGDELLVSGLRGEALLRIGVGALAAAWQGTRVV